MAPVRSASSPTTCSAFRRHRAGGAGRDRGQRRPLLDRHRSAGEGFFEGNFGSQPIRRGETFALPASLPFRVRAGREPVRVVRCLGPGAE